MNSESSRQKTLFDEMSDALNADEEITKRSLDELFCLAGQYKGSAEYWELLKFIGSFRFYAPYNAMLIRIQMTGATYVAPPHRWLKEYGRYIKQNARPLVILQPRGPVMFVFDVSDTEPGPEAQPLPASILNPFAIRQGAIGNERDYLIENAKRDGVEILLNDEGSVSAGSIGLVLDKKGYVKFSVRRKKAVEQINIPLRYCMLINSKHSKEVHFATIVHELAHLYLGHLGTPNEKWWPKRITHDNVLKEFEAESVAFLVCKRFGIETTSEKYLSGYLKENENVPNISLEMVMKAAGLIEQMAKGPLKPRKEKTE